MKKLLYQSAAIEIVRLQHSGQLLQGSGGMKKLDPFNNGGDPLNPTSLQDFFNSGNPFDSMVL